MRLYSGWALALVILPGSFPASAASSDVSPELRQRAEAACRDDALRLCSDAIPDESTIVACMRPKRASLSLPCRAVFDEVDRAVAR